MRPPCGLGKLQADGEKAHAALREDVECRELFGQHDRVMVGQQQHRRAEQQSAGRRRHVGKAFQRVGDGQIRGERYVGSVPW
jgi:hypothetical protein